MEESKVYKVHKVHIDRHTRGSGSNRRFTKGFAYCKCGWSTPIIFTEAKLLQLVREHEKGTDTNDV